MTGKLGSTHAINGEVPVVLRWRGFLLRFLSDKADQLNILDLASHEIIAGPFPDIQTAQAWIDEHHGDVRALPVTPKEYR